MADAQFETELVLSGPFRAPRQMLAEQTYGGHVSIHDDAMADKLGFKAGPIEGPTHFSQFVPLLVDHWGERFLERGCISFHYQNACTEGDRVRAFVSRPGSDADTVCDSGRRRRTGQPCSRARRHSGPSTTRRSSTSGWPACDPPRS